jgi:hypothetical protein
MRDCKVNGKKKTDFANAHIVVEAKISSHLTAPGKYFSFKTVSHK